MAAAMKANAQSYTLLHAQCDFLRSKGKHEWALKLARQAVNCAPSEFVTWEKLTVVYTELEQYDAVSWLLWLVRYDFPMLSTGFAHFEFVSNVHL